MGTYRKGANGAFSGKVGSVVGSHWKGIDYLRGLPRKPARPATQLQLDQRLRFAKVIGFMSPISEFVNLGFRNASRRGMSGYNMAVRHALVEAITGTYPGYALDYGKIRLSDGKLSNPPAMAVVSDVPGQLHFTWTDNSGGGSSWAHGDDRVMVLIANPATGDCYYRLKGPLRSSGECLVQPSGDFSGATVEVYSAFVSRDGKQTSRSVYLGQVTLA